MNAPTITPDTDLETLPRLPKGVPAGCNRVYFYDTATREELSDHPLNGATWRQSFGMAHYEGLHVAGTQRGFGVIVWTKSGPRMGVVGPETFPGRVVAGKVWHGEGEHEWGLLAAGDDSPIDSAATCRFPTVARRLLGGMKIEVCGRSYAAAMRRGVVA